MGRGLPASSHGHAGQQVRGHPEGVVRDRGDVRRASAAATTTWMSFNPTIPRGRRAASSGDSMIGRVSSACTAPTRSRCRGSSSAGDGMAAAAPAVLHTRTLERRLALGTPALGSCARPSAAEAHEAADNARRRRSGAVAQVHRRIGAITAQVRLVLCAAAGRPHLASERHAGATCFAFLIALLFFEQSYTELSERASMQLPPWRALEVLLVATLGVRYAFRIPFGQVLPAAGRAAGLELRRRLRRQRRLPAHAHRLHRLPSRTLLAGGDLSSSLAPPPS